MTEPRALPSRDSGTTIVELVIGLFLTAMAGWLVAELLSNTAERTSFDTIEHDASLAAAVFSRDVRIAERVEVEVSRGQVVALGLHHADGIVRWEIVNSTLTRQLPADPSPRLLLADLATASAFELRDAEGALVDPDDTSRVRWCTRLVVAKLSGVDEWTLSRASALRIAPPAGACR